MDDIQDEAAKHRLQERIDSAVSAALDSQRNKTEKTEVYTAVSISWSLLTCLVKQPRSSATIADSLGVSRRSGRKK